MNVLRATIEDAVLEPTSDALSLAVERAQAGDPDAFGEIVDATWERLVRLARSILADRQADAEDVVQDCLINAWSKLDSLRDPTAIRPWLQRSVARRCYRLAKKPRPEEYTERGEVSTSLLGLDLPTLLNQLSPRQRAVCYLGSVEGLDDREIAQRLGMLPPTVRVHRMRARRKLRRLLGEDP